ncbi:hypothetical protein ACIHCM_18410 [Streptomyces sp. NPDC052023]|uniref:hypothetical protein n=1 Tax=Streptomyces sp. NPDC052023 TaxID=3365681 RepID=UPI0037D71D98
MLRGVVHVLAWSLATGAATTLSWWGVHSVMAGTVYDPPRALPVTAAGTTTREPEPGPTAASTRRAEPSKTPSSSPATRGPVPPAAASSAPSPQAPASASASASGEVKSYATEGGRVVFDLGESSATLVSATPGAGWSMQVWKTQTWIRVEFAAGAERVSVFCTWHDGPPRVEIGTY